MIDMKILELAASLTEKAMGTDTTIAVWIGKEDQIMKFLKTTVMTLDVLHNETDSATVRR
jgi:hypothetical protein